MDVYACSPSKAKEYVELCMKARLVAYLQGSPGIGKSEIIKQLAEEYGLYVIDCRLSSMEPTDLMGLPWFNNGKAQFQPFEMFPIEGTPIPNGYSGWLLFLDEFNSASRATQAAAYKIVLDRMVGNHKLHDHCFVVAAGNKMTDNAITNRLSTAMLSRVIHLNMEVNFEDWRDNFALPRHIDERIIAYLSMYPNKLHEFDPEREEQTYCSPRTWAFVSKLIQANNGIVNNDIIPLLGGAITVEHASAFVQFCKVYKNIITVEDIQKNPHITPPSDIATLWAIVIHLINKTDQNNYKDVFTFMEKVPATLRVVYYKSIPKQHPELMTDSAFVTNIKSISDYLFGD